MNKNLVQKLSLCYGCDQPLHNYSMLVCADCLNDECEKFDLASGFESDNVQFNENVNFTQIQKNQ